MLRLPATDQWLDVDSILRVQRLGDGDLFVWPFGTNPTSPNSALRLSGTDAEALLDELGYEPEADDLTEINGIGDKTAAALSDAGFDSFAAVAEAGASALVEAVVAAGMVSPGETDAHDWIAQAAALRNERRAA